MNKFLLSSVFSLGLFLLVGNAAYADLTVAGTLNVTNVSSVGVITAAGPAIFNSTASTSIPLSIVGAPGQSGDLLDVASNSGTAGNLLRITSNGSLIANAVTSNGVATTTGPALFYSNAPVTIPVSITGATNQTGDYFDIASSVGGPGGVFKITSAGNLVSTGTLTGLTGLTVVSGAVSLPAASVGMATLTGVLPLVNGGTGSATQNFVDLTTAQTVAGIKTFSAGPVVSAGGLTVTGNSTIAGTLTGLTGFANTGTLTNTFTSATAGTGTIVNATNSNASVTATNVSGIGVALTGGTNGNSNANTVTGVNFSNVTPISNNTFNGITFGTGYNNYLTSGTVNLTAAGALSGLTGVTVASGGFNVTGNSTIAGTLTGLTGLTSSGTITLSGLSTNGLVTNTAAGVLGTLAGTTTTVLHGNAAGLPTYSAVGLTTDVTGILPVANGGTGSATQNFVDLTTTQTVAGVKTFSSGPVVSAGGVTVTGNSSIAGTLTGLTGLTSAGAIVLSGLSTNGVVHTTGGTGTLASSGVVNADLTTGSFPAITGVGTLGALTVNGNVTLGPATSHVISTQTTLPTETVVTYTAGTVLAGSTDTKGQFTVTTTAATGSVTLVFNVAYASAPICVVSPASANTQADASKTYVTSATTGLTVNYNVAPTANLQTWNYVCAQ